MNAMEKLLLMAERCESAMSGHQLSDTQSTCVGGLAGYVSVVKFCGRPILPPVVRVSVCVLHQSSMHWVSARFSILCFFKCVPGSLFLPFYDLIKHATWLKTRMQGIFSTSFYCHILVFFQCSVILPIQMTGRRVP